LQASLEAILFDCDGVIADTERDGHRVAFNRAFAASGIDERWGIDLYGHLLEVGGGKERMTAYWNEFGWPDCMENEDERQEKVRQLHLLKTDIFNQMIWEGAIPLRPGVLRLVDEAIQCGVRLACCSTSSVDAVTNLIRTLMGDERAAYFSIFAGDMVPRKKPAPDVYLMAVYEMGLDASRCVVIEDTSIGLAAAKAAGLSCVVTKSAYAALEDFTGADMVVEDLGEDPYAGVNVFTLESLISSPVF
jgi:HAD superfamily hydrolase (TIGR01509 family)